MTPGGSKAKRLILTLWTLKVTSGAPCNSCGRKMMEQHRDLWRMQKEEPVMSLQLFHSLCEFLSFRWFIGKLTSQAIPYQDQKWISTIYFLNTNVISSWKMQYHWWRFCIQSMITIMFMHYTYTQQLHMTLTAHMPAWLSDPSGELASCCEHNRGVAHGIICQHIP